MDGPATAHTRDVFVSYAHEDAEWVRVLVENLHRAGLKVFFDEWDLVGGQRLAQRLQEELAASRVVVLVVSAAAVGKQWWWEEFAGALAGVVAGSQRLVPVLLDEVATPVFAAARVYIDFRYVDSPSDYERRFRDLVKAIQGVPTGVRPERDGRLVPPPFRYQAEGPRLARLQVTSAEVVFSTRSSRVRHVPGHSVASVRSTLWDLRRAQHRPGAVLRGGTGVLHAALVETGRALGEWCLAGAAGEALAAAVALAGSSLRLAIEVDEPELADLPWETLTLPGQQVPLVLHPGVELHRCVAVDNPVDVVVPGPLRILAVIASPERGGGKLLDYEAELARILAAVDPSRRRDGAYVRVLNWGTPEAIHAALSEERFHVLHLSCHAEPGTLVLESDTGDAVCVDAQRLVNDVLVRDERVPLVVLAGCSTALGATPTTDAPDDPARDEVLGGLARDLLRAGVPSVLAMTAPVTDRYATQLCAEIYRGLARRQEPTPLTEVATVRRVLEEARQALPENDPHAAWAEWATPALFHSGAVRPLYRRTDATGELARRVEPRVQLGEMIRQVGDFVGRRAELRAIVRALDDDGSGRRAVLLHGIGGIGKSSLAAQAVQQLGAEAGLIVVVSGATRVEPVLEQIRCRLLVHCLNHEAGERDPLRQLVAVLADATRPWPQRLELIREVALERLPISLVLDNVEDMLVSVDGDWKLADGELAAFLLAWTRADRTRLIITSRYPFGLPDGTQLRVSHHHIGPLSKAETRKLFWRLPAVDALSAEQQQQAYTDVGGHPRALEYLDALLAGGRARFDDVAERIETALARGGDDPAAWLSGVKGDIVRALDKTVSLAADDVLLADLLAEVDTVPLARELLVGAAVYEDPVDEIGLAWQISAEVEPAPDPERDERMRRAGERFDRALHLQLTPDQAGITDELVAQHLRDRERLCRPPLTIAPEFDAARSVLLRTGLLSQVGTSDPDDETRYLVHRWTARAIVASTDVDQQTKAHRRAAHYWQWRCSAVFQDQTDDLRQLIFARNHYHRAGELVSAVLFSDLVCDQLHTRGAWTWERQLCLEVVEWLRAAQTNEWVEFFHLAFVNKLGVISQMQGDIREAERRYRAALAIAERAGNQHGIAVGNHQLGMIAQRIGDVDEADRRYRAALLIDDEIGDRASSAISNYQLGMIARQRGDQREAERLFEASLTICEEVRDWRGVAKVYSQLAAIAEDRGNLEDAGRLYRRAMGINTQLQDADGVAHAHYGLGRLAYRQRQYRSAERCFQAALGQAEEIGNLAVVADCYEAIGGVAEVSGDLSGAERCYVTAIALVDSFSDVARRTSICYRRANIALLRDDLDAAKHHYDAVLAVAGQADHDQIRTARCHHQLGLIAHLNSDHAEAARQYRAALDLTTEIGEQRGMAASCHLELGKLAQAQGEYADARRHYEKSLTILEDLDDRDGIAAVVGRLDELRAVRSEKG